MNLEFFTKEEFNEKYGIVINENWKIEAVSEMILSQVGLIKRGDSDWNTETVPLPIKKATMEQMRFMLEHNIPFIDSNDIKAGTMHSKLNSDYSTLALRILANNGYMFRGNPINQNMGLQVPFGG